MLNYNDKKILNTSLICFKSICFDFVIHLFFFYLRNNVIILLSLILDYKFNLLLSKIITKTISWKSISSVTVIRGFNSFIKLNKSTT